MATLPLAPPIGAPRLDEVPPLCSFLENIIDKKVNDIALSLFESIIDFFCRYLYFPYNKRLEFRVSEKDDSPTAEKIHYFMDGAPLYDRTSTLRADIKREQLFDLIKGKKIEGDDDIYLDDKKVRFSTGRLLFGKTHDTQEVYVTDIEECPELVMIYERETAGNLKAWCVDTTQPTTETIRGGDLEIGDDVEIYMAHPIAPLPAPAPIYRSIV